MDSTCSDVLARKAKGLRGSNSNKVQVMLAALKACTRTRNLARGKQVHVEALECPHIHVANSLINMYAKCGSMVHAREVFDGVKHPDVVSWNALILGYADNGQGHIALDMLACMRTEGPVPDSVTLLAALKACTSLAVKGDSECRKRGKEIHNIALENGCSSDVYVQSRLVDMYSKCSSMVDAREVFDGMKHPDVVSWTALIMGYAENDQGLDALDMFTRMRTEGPAPDSVILVAVLKACTSLVAKEGASRWAEYRNRARQIHNIAVENGWNSDIFVQNTLIDMYAKCGSMAESHEIFGRMQRPDVVSWTALILGYAENGQGHTALNMFTRMKRHGPTPNFVTLVAALKACSLVGAFEFGRTIHSELDKGNNLNVVLVTCLVDFYAKCGSMMEAQRIFELHPESRDTISWNAMLAGFMSCGNSEGVFGLFEIMQDAGFQPNGVTFLCMLTCCSHEGLVEKGKEIFEAMSTKYGTIPSIEHYTCMIDLFGRANKLDDAMTLLKDMPCSPNHVTWATILGACRKWKNLELGRFAFQSLIDLNGGDAAAYVLMGQIYGSRGMLHEQRIVMELRKELKADVPGETYWTNEAGDVHTFSAKDSCHPQITQIHEKWEIMSMVLKEHGGYTPNLIEEEAVCGHSERLALVCALINSKPGKTIRIVKNLRVCGDCHTVITLISKLECRTIICRDASVMHFFKDGKCSCGDYW